MSQRTEKVESLVQQVVARELLERLPADSARITVTGVDAAPDLRNATVWIGLLADNEKQHKLLWQQVLDVRADIQHQVAGAMTTKFAPRLSFRFDSGGEYAAFIDGLLKKL